MLQYKYNPLNASFEELKATFTARDALLANLLEEINKNATGPSNQHYLVIGPRGMGKTNFLRMIYFSIKQNDARSKQWLPIQFAEEEYAIGSLRDLFEKVLELLREETAAEQEIVHVVEESLAELQAESRNEVAAEKAIACLKDLSRQLNKKFFLLVDNLDLILGDQLKNAVEVKRLRDLLMNEWFLTLVGAAPTYFEEVASYDKPLHNFFKIINLEELTVDEIEDLIRKRAEFDGRTDLLQRLPQIRSRLKALRHLTGGNPRLILLLYQLLTMGELTEIKDYLQSLLDDLTPYYQFKLHWLSPQQRRIIDSMARLNRAVSPTEIAVDTRLSVNAVSSNLKRLQDWGYVKLAQQARRKSTYYIVSERLFRIWHQMRHAPGLRQKIRFFVEFIQVWYTLEEMQAEWQRLSRGFETYRAAGELTKAKRLIEHLDYLAEASPELRRLSDQVIGMMLKVEDLEGAEARLKEKINACSKDESPEELAQAYWGLGVVHQMKKNFSEAIRDYDRALKIKPDLHEAWYNRGVALADLGRYEEAIKSYDRALKIKPDLHAAWNNRGLALAVSGRHEEAIENFNQGLKLVKTDRDRQIIHFGLFLAYLNATADPILGHDYGQGKAKFAAALDSLLHIRDEPFFYQSKKTLVKYFATIVSEQHSAVVSELLSLLREKGFSDELAFLEPFRIATEYWEKGQDAEVLDRLNPEVREVVEQILRKTEAS